MGNLPPNPNIGLTFNAGNLKEIYLAGGCFWGVEAYFARLKGVSNSESGYANGKTSNPTYEDVCKRNSGHAETVKVTYDPEMISLEDILEEYFYIIDPTSLNKQGEDEGTQYRTGIYFTIAEDEQLIHQVIQVQKGKYNAPIVTEVLPLEHFYYAEDYHQDYLEKNPNGYCHIDFRKLAKK